MKMQVLNPFIPLQWQQPAGQNVDAVGTQSGSFASTLHKALGEVNKLQVSADEAAQELAMGEAEDIHQVMIAMEQANMAMQLTVQVRNKMVEAYQEVSRMQL